MSVYRSPPPYTASGNTYPLIWVVVGVGCGIRNPDREGGRRNAGESGTLRDKVTSYDRLGGVFGGRGVCLHVPAIRVLASGNHISAMRHMRHL